MFRLRVAFQNGQRIAIGDAHHNAFQGFGHELSTEGKNRYQQQVAVRAQEDSFSRWLSEQGVIESGRAAG